MGHKKFYRAIKKKNKKRVVCKVGTPIFQWFVDHVCWIIRESESTNCEFHMPSAPLLNQQRIGSVTRGSSSLFATPKFPPCFPMQDSSGVTGRTVEKHQQLMKRTCVTSHTCKITRSIWTISILGSNNAWCLSSDGLKDVWWFRNISQLIPQNMVSLLTSLLWREIEGSLHWAGLLLQTFSCQRHSGSPDLSNIKIRLNYIPIYICCKLSSVTVYS